MSDAPTVPPPGRRQAGTYPDADERVQAVLFAALHGDEAASARFQITTRTLRKYRAELRDPESDLSKVFRRYASVVRPEVRAVDFLGWMQARVMDLSDVILLKAREVNPNNPESIRAINEHVETLLGHTAALVYIGYLFGQGAGGDEDGRQRDDEEPPHRTFGVPRARA